MNKKLITGVGIFFAIIFATTVGGALLLTQPLVNATEEYLVLISQGRIDQAFQMTTGKVQAAVNFIEFEEANSESLLAKYVDVSWNHRSIEGASGELQGTLYTSDEVYSEVGISVTLEKENGKWKIFYVELW